VAAQHGKTLAKLAAERHAPSAELEIAGVGAEFARSEKYLVVDERRTGAKPPKISASARTRGERKLCPNRLEQC
jgi:hypothetical protein